MILLSNLRKLSSLKSLDAFPLFVLSGVFLEVKQKFKYRGVDKCDICMGSLNILVSFIKINLHYFAIYAHISRITLGFSLFGF